jgi:hypothetical protein
VLVGESSDTLTLTLANPGSADLNVTAIDVPAAPFAQLASSCEAVPFVLAPAASCTIDVSFTPTAPGAASQLITVSSDAPPGSDGEATLQGNGVEDTPEVPDAVDVPALDARSIALLALLMLLFGAMSHGRRGARHIQ